MFPIMFNDQLFNQAPTTTPAAATADECIEIFTAIGERVAMLAPEADNIKEAWIDDNENGRCTLTFNLPLTSEKWQYVSNSYRIRAAGKEFVISNPDAVEKSRDGEKLWGKVQAHESWVRLGQKYVTVSNDPLNTDPAWSQVAIISGGSDLSGGRYAVGTAGHALYAVLQGSGWELDTCDVTGTFDLETEKENVLANITQIQETWGGILIWDSLSHKVSLRDEATYKPYSGYQVRYAKNLKGITRSEDRHITTRLYPFGADDLSIASVNGGKLYLENFQYTNEVLEDTWINQDIGYPEELKARAERELEKLSRPRFNYTIKMLDLRTIPGFQHEKFKRSDTVDVIDEDLGTNAQMRIIRHRYNVFQRWLCEIETGDPLEKTEANMLANSVAAANYVRSSVKPNTTFQNILKAKIDTAATEINGASGDYQLVDGVSSWFERVNGVLTGKVVRITPVGIIISSDGGQTWDLAINGEGINASLINAGELNTGLVRVISPGSKVIIDSAGLEVVDGKIYGSYIKSGAKSNVIDFIEMTTDGKLNVFGGGVKGLVLSTDDAFGGRIDFLNSAGAVSATLRGPYSDATYDLFLRLYGSNTMRILGSLSASQSIAGANVTATSKVESGGTMVCGTNFFCYGSEADFDGKLYTGDDIHCGGIVWGTEKKNTEFTEYGPITLSAVEAGENTYFDRGRGQLINGECTITLDPLFLACIAPDSDIAPWSFHTEVYGEGENIRVVDWDEKSFRVKECNGGTSNRRFGWWLYATRKDYEGIRFPERVFENGKQKQRRSAI